MKSHLLIAFTASLFLLACGDDGDDTTPDSSTPAMCVGAGYTSFTPAEFVDGAAASGMCVNASDLNVACTTDLTDVVGDCGSSCFAADPGATEQELAACVANCVKVDDPRTVVDPSDACLNCYLASVGCTFEFCLAECAGGATLPGCISCRAENGCTSAFFTCSGLPAPQAP